MDEEGPVGAVLLIDWGRVWGCDPILVPGVSSVRLDAIWTRAIEIVDGLSLDIVEVLARDDDFDLPTLLASAGFVETDDRSGTAWMNADDRPEVPPSQKGLCS
jgi:hypothetical protein